MKLWLSSPTLKIFFFFFIAFPKKTLSQKKKKSKRFPFSDLSFPINEMEFVYSFSCSYSEFLNN